LSAFASIRARIRIFNNLHYIMYKPGSQYFSSKCVRGPACRKQARKSEADASDFFRVYQRLKDNLPPKALTCKAKKYIISTDEVQKTNENETEKKTLN